MVRAYLLPDAVALDLYKRVPGSFRPWDQELRQPLLLHSHDAVIAIAPLEKLLHEGNELDSLGTDRPERVMRQKSSRSRRRRRPVLS